MIRSLALFTAMLALAAPYGPARAEGELTPAITCRVLLKATPIPDDTGRFVSIEEITVPPGHDGHLHDHDWKEYLTVLSGTGTLAVNSQPDRPLSPNMVAVIPMHVPHQEHNASDKVSRIFTATFLEDAKGHAITHYESDPDKPHGCPHVRK